MKKYLACIIASAVVAIGGATVLPAVAKPAAPTQTTVTCGTCVAPITCIVEDSCVLDFVGNGGKGYWRARQENGTIWVRLTLVNGQ